MLPPNPTIAVIIPTYNRASLLTQALDSVLDQTRCPDEVIVIDDGSSDGTVAILSRYGGQIRCYRQANAGKPAALNRALERVRSDYVWIMDDDDVALPDALERHLNHLKAHPEVDYTYSGVYCFDGDNPPPPAERCHLWQRRAIPHDDFFVRALEEFPCNQQTMLVPLSCYRTVGGYDEKQTFAEDYEMILRLARRYRAGFVEKPTIYLRQHGGERGPARERCAADKRFETWRPYERRLFARLRETLPLVEYLPRRAVAGPLNPAQVRRALLQRACVMGRHGLFDKALADLEAATSRSALAPWSSEEKRICAQMLNVEPLVLAGQADFLRRSRRLLRQYAPGLHRAAGAGIGWSGMAELRAGHYRGAAQMSARLLRWAGPAGLAGIAAAKLTQKGTTSGRAVQQR